MESLARGESFATAALASGYGSVKYVQKLAGRLWPDVVRERERVANLPKAVDPEADRARADPLAWAALASRGRWTPSEWPHLRLVGERLAAVARGECLRLVVSMPPRHGKSQTVSRFFAGWWLGAHPDERVIVVSMQEGLSRGWSRQVRDDFREHGERAFGVTAARAASTIEWSPLRLGQAAEGSFSAVGALGTIVGKGAHLVVVDDLIKKLEDAQNGDLREKAWEWFQSSVLTRLELPGRVVICMTRWHADDVIGRLEKLQAAGELGERWEFVNLAAVAEEGDPLGRRPGEPLWPERFSKERLAKIEKDVGPYVWAANYQGSPRQREGAIFRAEWFEHRYSSVGAGPERLLEFPGRGRASPSGAVRFATVDLAASKKERANYTVIASWAFFADLALLALLEIDRDRSAPHEILPRLRRARSAWNLGAIYAEREGPWLEERLGGLLRAAAEEGLPIVELNPEGDKVSRAMGACGPFAAGQVWLPDKAPWVRAFVDEMLAFYGGEYDDQVDAATYAAAIFQNLVARVPSKARAAAPKPAGRRWLGERKGGWL